MKTNQILTSRQLFGGIVEQRTDDGFFNLTDIVKIGNSWRIKNDMPQFNFSAYLKSKQTKEFMNGLEKKYGVILKKSRGKGDKTWGHPLLFIDVALSISPKLKIEVYEWIMDLLVKYRCQSGDSYQRMCGAIWKYTTDRANFKKNITTLANFIKKECGVEGDWNSATETQLIRRDRIHDNIAGLCGTLKEVQKAVEMGILLTRQQMIEIN